MANSKPTKYRYPVVVMDAPPGEIAPINRKQALVVLAFHLAFLIWSVLMPSGSPVVGIINHALVVTMAVGSLVVIGGAVFELEHPTFSPQQQSHARSMRRGIVLMSGTVLFNVIQAVHKGYLMLGDTKATFPNASDYWQIPALAMTVAAIYVMPGLRTERGTRNRLFLDQLIFTSAFATLGWYFFLGPAIQVSPASRGPLVLQAVMILINLVALASAITLTAQFRLPVLNKAKLCLMFSCLLGLVADSMGLFGVMGRTDPTAVIGMQVARSLSFVMLAWSGRFWVRLDYRDALKTQSHAVWWRQIFSYGPVIPAFAISSIVVYKGTGGVVAQGVYPCAFFMMLMIFLRQFSTLQENVRLANRIQDTLEELESKNTEVLGYVKDLESTASHLAATQEELESSYDKLKEKNRLTEQYAQQLRQAMESVEAKNRQVVGYARQVEAANGKLIEMQTVLSQSLAEVEVMRIDLQKSNESLMAANHMLLHSASVDGMTGLWNHGTFQERLAEAAAQYDRHHQPFCLMLIDVDHFKKYNDSFGHPAGDEALKIVAKILRENVRSSDIVARYGGEEFAVLLRNTNFMSGFAAAERIRKIVESAEFPKREVTVSIGLAGGEKADGVPAAVIASADAALYVSKHLGRNRVTVYEYIEWEEEPVTAQPIAA